MMSPTQFAELKRDICQRLMTQIPDAALGELIVTMREIIEHYGTYEAEVKTRVEAETAQAVTLTPPQANIPEPTKQQKPTTTPTIPSRRTIVAGLNQTTPMKKQSDAPKQPPVPPVPAPKAKTPRSELPDTQPFNPEPLPDEEEETPTRPAAKAPDLVSQDLVKKDNSMPRPADFADQLKKMREEKAQAVAEARRLKGLKPDNKASSAS